MPIFALAFSKYSFSTQEIIKFIKFSLWLYFSIFVFWLLFKSCSITNALCSFGGLYKARNATGGFLSILSISSFVLWLNGFKKFKYATLIFLLMLFATYSRGSILGFVLSSIVMYFLYKRNLLLDKIFFIFLFIGTIFITLYFYQPDRDYVDIHNVLSLYIDSNVGTKMANVIIRVAYLWPKALHMFLESPIIGNGFGSFDDYGIGIGNIHSDSHAHNTFFHFLAELGIIGFSIFMIFVLSLRSFWKKYRTKYRLIADIAYFSFLTVLFASFTEHRLTTPSSMIVVSIFIGIFISHVRFHKGLPE